MGKAKDQEHSGSVERLSTVSLQRVPPIELDVDAPDERYAKLSQITADYTIPRLLALRDRTDTTTIHSPASLGTEEVHELGKLILGPDTETATGFLLNLRDRGVSLDDLHTMLLGPTASYLGQLWDQDKIDFVDVTLGVARLQRLVITFEGLDDVLGRDDKKEIMIVGAPGEHHSLGNAIIQRFFRASGWQVWNCITPKLEDVARIAAENWFGVIGFSISLDTHLEELRRAIARLRAESLNEGVYVIVGGSAINSHPQWVQDLGADGTADSGPTAVLLANKLLASPRK